MFGVYCWMTNIIQNKIVMQSSYTVKHVVRDAAEHMAMVGLFRVAIYRVTHLNYSLICPGMYSTASTE